MNTRTVVVTGASAGIGRALAMHLASLDHNVIAVGRNEASLLSLQNSNADKITAVVADVTKSDDLLKIKSAIKIDTQGLILIHNAGVAEPQLLEGLSEEHWDKHYATNTKAPIFLTKLLMPFLENGGRVLTLSTGLAHSPMAAMSAYGVSKAAIYHWKEFCNVELASHGVLFGSVKPGVVDTRVQESLRNYDSSAFPAANVFKGFHDRGELLAPDTVAKFLAWLVIKADDDAFTKGDWDIYDLSHRELWANPGEIKDRESNGTSKTIPADNQVSLLNNSFFNSIRNSKYLTTAAVSTATFVAGVLITRALYK